MTNANENYYAILGVQRTASQQQITKAYRTKLKDFKGVDLNDMKYRKPFHKLRRAYEVLSDPTKRIAYDREHALRTGTFNFGAINRSQLSKSSTSKPRGKLPDLPPESWGATRTLNQSPLIKQTLYVTLNEIYNGCRKYVTIKKYHETNERNDYLLVCGYVRSQSYMKPLINLLYEFYHQPSIICNDCAGRGTNMTTTRRGYMTMQTRKQCKICNGNGWLDLGIKEIQLNFNVPKICEPLRKIEFNGMGHEYPNYSPGDVIIEFKDIKDKIFKRVKYDLFVSYMLTLEEAIFGFKKILLHPSNKKLLIQSNENEIIQPQTVRKIENYGMPTNNIGGFGHLYVKFDVKLPTVLTKKKREMFGNLLQKTDKNLGIIEESLDNYTTGHGETVVDKEIDDKFEDKNQKDSVECKQF